MTPKQKQELVTKMRALLDEVIEQAVNDDQAMPALKEAMQLLSGEKPFLAVTGFHMRNHRDGFIEVLVQHGNRWITVFGADGPGPRARDLDQTIDHMIHAGGIANLRDHGSVHTPPSPPARICASCGNPEKPHRFRHRFVLWEPGMPKPRRRGLVERRTR